MSTVVWISEVDFPAIMQLDTDYDAVDIVYEVIPGRRSSELKDEVADNNSRVNRAPIRPLGTDFEESATLEHQAEGDQSLAQFTDAIR